MATVINTLYPPQIGGSGTFMPAFVVDDNGAGTAYVRFSISPYNSSNDIQGVQATCVRMDSNLNALAAPTGVYCEKLGNLKTDGNEYLFPIEYTVPTPDTPQTQSDEPAPAKMNSGFVTDVYYKVQLRFDCSGDGLKTGNLDSAYLIQNTDKFSEWSSVCLIKPIGTPSVIITGFTGSDDVLLGDTDIPLFNRGIIPVSGRVDFSPSGEHIESYKIYVSSVKTEEIVFESDNMFSSNDSFEYKLDTEGYSTTLGNEFNLYLSFITQNQYTFNSPEYKFELGEFSRNDYFKPTIDVESLPDNGAVRVTVENGTAVSGVLLIKRASSLNDYHDWETVHAVAVNGPVNTSFEDMTVCSGVIYRYSVTLETIKGSIDEKGVLNISNRYYTKAYKSIKVIPDFYDAMFYRLGKQMAVRYNFSISSFKPVVNRTKVDTLGGKYPRFVENATLGYKQFSLSGMISSQEDPDCKFISRDEYYKDHLDDILKYNSNNEVRTPYDFFWEREFREQLLKWLNDGEPKLMKTMTEGNLCVMLTDISLTPNTTLGRRLYTFTATAYEVEDGTDLATIMSLGIHSNGLEEAEQKLDDTISDGQSITKVEKIGQFYESIPLMRHPDEFTTAESVKDIVMETLRWRFGKGGAYLGHSAENVYLHDVRVTFLSNPHLYFVSDEDKVFFGKVPKKGTDNSASAQAIEGKDSETDITDDIFYVSGLTKHDGSKGHNLEQKGAIMSGYRMSLNDKDIFVNIGRTYQVPSIIKVNDMSFPSVKEADEQERDIVTIDYVLCYDDVFDRSKLPSSTENMTSYKNVFGQISGVYQPGERLGDRVYKKYTTSTIEKERTISYTMDYWKGISLEVPPYTVFEIMFEDDTAYQRITVGPSGIYNIDDGFPCEDLYFEGIKIFRHGCNRDVEVDETKDFEDTQQENCRRETLTAGEFYYAGRLSLKKDRKPVPGRVYITDDENGTMQFYSLDKKWYDFTPEPAMVPYQNTGSSVINYKPNRNPKAGIIGVPISGMLNYVGTIMKKYE